jgi:hypothetical protein
MIYQKKKITNFSTFIHSYLQFFFYMNGGKKNLVTNLQVVKKIEPMMMRLALNLHWN